MTPGTGTAASRNSEVRADPAMPRIACIGAGHWGKNLVRNFANLGALHTVCETSPALSKGLNEAYPDARIVSDYQAVLADPNIDAVVIATPAESHHEMVKAALLAGKDVFVEKPLCLTPREGEEVVELAAKLNRVLMVGHLLWYHPAILTIQSMIKKGELGRLQYIYSNRLNLGKIRREENILWSFAPHDISVIIGLVGENPVNVRAQGGYYLHDDIADVTVSLLNFRSGIKAHVFVSWLHPYKEQKLVIVGDRQMAVFDDTAKEHKLVLYPHKIDWREGLPFPSPASGIPVELPAGEPLRAECEHFIECVQTRATPRTDGAEALRVLRVLEQCDRSLLLAKQMSNAQNEPPKTEPAKPEFTAHESAVIDAGVEIGKGTTIWHFSHMLKNTKIGEQCRIGQNVVIGPNVVVGNGVKIQNNVSVYEGVKLEDDVFCGPSMVFTNVYNPRSEIRRMDEIRETLVKKGASIGANSTIVCGTTIGRYSFVGAGSVVIRDVPDHALIVGNPGRQVGWVCTCGNRIEFKGKNGVCGTCGNKYTNTDGVVAPTA